MELADSEKGVVVSVGILAIHFHAHCHIFRFRRQMRFCIITFPGGFA
jgi:hypothetical protein